MSIRPAARARALARGPVRTAIRSAQARHPALRAGRAGGPPGYVGVGVQRSGTSWWHGLIESHPEVTPLGFGVKELHFFDGFWGQDFTERDEAAYRAQFLRRGRTLVGEWTPRYLFDPWTMPLLRRAAPDARILVMLRDPVDRFVSGLKHARKTSRTLTPDDVTVSFLRGCYADQVRRLLDCYPREQILALQFEQCVREPDRFLAATFDFLRLPPAPTARSVPQNAAAATADVPDTVLRELRSRYERDVTVTAQLLPDAIDLSLWA